MLRRARMHAAPTDPVIRDQTMRHPARFERLIALTVLLLLLLGSLVVLWPFLFALAWALVMAFALWPLQRRLPAVLRRRKTLAALAMTSAIALVLLVPTTVIVVNLGDDARALTTATKRWIADGPPAAPPWVQRLPLVGDRAAAYWNELSADAAELLRRARASAEEQQSATTLPSTQPAGDTKLARLLGLVFAWAADWLPRAGLAMVQGLTQILLSVLLTFFIFRDGEVLAQRLTVMINRIAGTRGVELLQIAGSTVRGVVYGILGTALVQGVLAAIGFLIAGVPGAALLGLLTFLFSPLPIGPPLIWLPAAAWLFHQGNHGWGVFMLVWGVLVSSVDNVVKPWIISRGGATPFILILFGVIGGALAFGFIGVFLGPTLLTVVYRMIEEWSRSADQVAQEVTS